MRRLLALACLLVACDPDAVQFSGGMDNTALSHITGNWSGLDGLSLVLTCEPTPPVADGCDVAHVVTLNSPDEELSPGLGLDSCPRHVVSYVEGTISGGPYGATSRAVAGRVVLGTLDDGAAVYDRPYTLDMDCDLLAAPCLVRGEFDADGRLTLTYQDGRSLGTLSRW